MADHLYTVEYISMVLAVGLPHDFEQPTMAVLGDDDLNDMEMPNSARSDSFEDRARHTELNMISAINHYFSERDIDLEEMTSHIRQALRRDERE